MPAAAGSPRRTRLLGIMAWGALTAMLWAGSELYLRSAAQDAVGNGLAQAELAAEAVGQTMLQTLQAVEGLHALVQARYGLQATGNTVGAQAIEQHLVTTASLGQFGVRQVAVIDSASWLEWTSVPDFERVRLTDRDHFRIHAEYGHPHLYVSEPLTGRTSRRLSVQLTRPIEGLDGGFAGVAVVSLDPTIVSEALAGLRLARAEIAAVFRLSDGVVLAASRPGQPPMIGTSVPLGATVLQDIRNGDTGARRLTLPDGTDTLIAFRSLPEGGLAVAFGLDTRRELASLNTLRGLLRAWVAAASALAGLAIMLALVWMGRRQTAAALAKAELEREVALARAARSQRVEALGTLAGGVAHDVNNVLQAVLSGAMLIRKRSGDERIAEIAETIIGSARRGAAVTGRLLALARRAELKAQPLNAGEVLTAIAKVLAFSPGPAVEISVDVPRGLPPLAADRSQLEAVLVNLAGDGREAMEQLGGGMLTLRAAAETIEADPAHPAGLRPGRYIRMDVVDTGVGMDLETLARAGEPFFTTKRGTKGTGLGLAMARGFAEQSGGGLRIVSAPGAGIRVSLWLPEGNRLPVPAIAPAVRGAAVGQAVLLVDDEAAVRGMLAGFLRDAGHLVAEAGDGREALVRIGAGAACDLLVADLSMPGLDGLAVIREARTTRPGLPALLVTGHVGDADEDALADAQAGGPFRLLRKPIEPDALNAAAAALLEPRHGGPWRAAPGSP